MMTLSVHVLLIDDDEISRSIAEHLLNELGFRVTCSESGPEAIELLKRSNDFDIVLVDYFMPGMDGYETAIAIREVPPHGGQIPLIAVTADECALVGELPSPSPFAAVVSKPFTAHSLLRALSAGLPDADIPVPRPESPSLLDQEHGLRQFFSSWTAYSEVLSHFSGYKGTFFRSFEFALSGQDYSDCRRLAHGLKGSLSMIGALAARNAAASLETACAEARDPREIEFSYDEMKRILNHLDREIGRLLSERG